MSPCSSMIPIMAETRGRELSPVIASISCCLSSFIELSSVTKSAGLLCVSNIHKGHGFSKSKAWLGIIGPLQRARVSDLISDDYDRPASPPQRVPRIVFNVSFKKFPPEASSFLYWFSFLLAPQAAQRGVDCTEQILRFLMDGTDFAEGTPIFVCELLHNKCSDSRMSFALKFVLHSPLLKPE